MVGLLGSLLLSPFPSVLVLPFPHVSCVVFCGFLLLLCRFCLRMLGRSICCSYPMGPTLFGRCDLCLHCFLHIGRLHLAPVLVPAPVVFWCSGCLSFWMRVCAEIRIFPNYSGGRYRTLPPLGVSRPGFLLQLCSVLLLICPNQWFTVFGAGHKVDSSCPYCAPVPCRWHLVLEE